MSSHFHTGIDHLVLNAIGVLLVIHATRFLAAKLTNVNNDAVSTLGKSLGAVVHFGG